MNRLEMETPVGWLAIEAKADRLSAVRWGRAADAFPTPVLAEARSQLDAYFSGTLEDFDLPFDPPASPFAADIREAMLAIPFGETLTYGDIAARIGASPQAVGQGCGANPLPILVPCHRVLGANGLGGFSGGTGIETKVALLRHEGAAGLLI
ncbi:MAG: methylated-DNA--[protein]-cysteine S-methyltransferase [Pseudomonadota bacterium]